MSPARDTAAAVADRPTPAPRRRSALAIYVGRIGEFDRTDWIVYVAWIGLMLGLCGSTGGFLLFGRAHGVTWPAEAWLVPVGAMIFTTAIAIDTIGHRTIYKEALKGGEQLVHQITIFCGITSCILLVLAYRYTACAIPALVFTILSFVYSLVDEAFHWRRYVTAKADPVEMWSHVGIFIGHGIMMLGWWSFYQQGYPGVRDALIALGAGA
jgi:hypothetical protein